MTRVSESILRLKSLRARPGADVEPHRSGALGRFENFGSNPGDLDAWLYVPEHNGGPMPLVVVLHGCTQNARDYDRSAGWSQLGSELGFAVLLPEQRRSNNFNLCFNWYEPSDNQRGAGEATSIKQMIEAAIAQHGLDPARVFVNGLSAGGAMTSVMLAAYPEMFAAGAIIAGLPYGSANSVPEAFQRMRGYGSPDGPALANLVRAASPTGGPWPMISVWHGDADHVVVPINGDNIIEQWRPLHGASETAAVTDTVEGYPHRVWHDPGGRPAVQEYRITGMGHGTPLATTGEEACGAPADHMLDAAISSTRRIAYDWGLGGAKPNNTTIAPKGTGATAGIPRHPKRATAESRTAASGRVGKVTKTIEDALRAAGLM